MPPKGVYAPRPALAGRASKIPPTWSTIMSGLRVRAMSQTSARLPHNVFKLSHASGVAQSLHGAHAACASFLSSPWALSPFRR
jgi:hypothetical protein